MDLSRTRRLAGSKGGGRARLVAWSFVVVLAATTACRTASERAAPPPPDESAPAARPEERKPAEMTEPVESIGVATMQPDGTIVLQLRAQGPGPMIGDAQFSYPKDHPQYDMVLKHLGGLTPGQSKSVPPWP